MSDFKTLILRKHWFDMILSGEKKEEYRDITKYWTRRLVGDWHNYQDRLPKYRGEYLLPYRVDKILFKNGYNADSPQFLIEWHSLKIDTPKIDWFPRDQPIDKFVFCLHLGEILETKFLNTQI